MNTTIIKSISPDLFVVDRNFETTRAEFIGINFKTRIITAAAEPNTDKNLLEKVLKNDKISVAYVTYPLLEDTQHCYVVTIQKN